MTNQDFKTLPRHTRRTGPRRLSRWVMISALAGAALIGVGAAVSASGGPGGHFGGGWGFPSPSEFAAARADRLLDGIEATPEQRARVREIVATAVRDMEAVRGTFRDTRGEMARILAAPELDRAAAERLRGEKLGLADRASKRLVTAIIDVAEALTPEQRAKLRDRMAERSWRPPFWR